MGDYIVQTKSLVKQYGKQKAVNNINLNIRRGSIYGIVGRNGAGKSTLLKLISSLIHPTSGEIKILGYDYTDRKVLYDRVGSLIEIPGLYGNLNAFDNLKLKALCLGIYNEKDINNIIKLVGLENDVKKKVKNYSLGMKQRLGIAMAIVGHPDVLVLDEPINGLDPQGIVEIRELIQKLNKENNMTIVVSSHILEELFKVITDIAFIENGELLEEISKKDLLDKCSEKIQIVTFDTKKACVVLDDMGCNNYKVLNKNTICVYEKAEKLNEINKALVKNEVVLQGIFIKNDSLEEYFVNLVGGKKNA